MGLFSTEAIAAMSGVKIVAPPADYRLPTTFPSLSKAHRIAIDFESHDESLGADKGPGWRRGAYPLGIGVAIQNRDGSIPFQEYYPVAHNTGPNLDATKVWEWLADEMNFYTGEIVGANLLYEGDCLQYRGVMPMFAKWRDVQWAEALIDENAFNYKLDAISKKYLKEGKVVDTLHAMYGPGIVERLRDVHPGHMRSYCLGDLTLPLRILHEQGKELKRQNLTDLFDLESRLLPMLLYMRRIGARVDLDKAGSLREQFTHTIDDSLKKATALVGIRGFELNRENFGKPTVLGQVFEKLGIEVPRTSTGLPSVTDVWLHGLCDCKDSKDKDIMCGIHIGRLLEAANKCDKALGTFVDGYITDYQINGRVHAEFHPLRRDKKDGGTGGTVSGRFSSSNPNLQNIPARDKIIGPLCRSMFIAEPDMDYFSGDYSQIEFRLLVHAAVARAMEDKSNATKRWGKNGPEIWEALQSAYKAQSMYRDDPTTDFHNMVVALTGLDRKYAKNINFGIAFTMGVEKLARSLGLIGPDGKPLPRALEIMAQYHTNVPFVKAVGQAMTYEANHDGFVCTLLGRRTHFERWEPKYSERGAPRAKALPYDEAVAEYGEKLKRSMTHKSLNCFTQGSGADLMKTAMVNIWESGILSDPSELLISLTVHDELDGCVGRTARAQEKLRELQHMMETALTIHVPILTDFKTGIDWSKTH